MEVINRARVDVSQIWETAEIESQQKLDKQYLRRNSIVGDVVTWPCGSIVGEGRCGCFFDHGYDEIVSAYVWRGE